MRRNMCWRNMFLVWFVVLIVNCAIADKQKCDNGICTVQPDANENETNETHDHHHHHRLETTTASEENETTNTIFQTTTLQLPTTMEQTTTTKDQTTTTTMEQTTITMFQTTTTMLPASTTFPASTTMLPTSTNVVQENDSENSDMETTSEFSTTSEPETTSMQPLIFVTVPSTSNPTTLPISTEPARGRAINFTLEEHHTENGITANSSNSMKKELKDLSDVTMDDDEEEIQKHPVLAKITEEMDRNLEMSTNGVCVKGGLTYSHGEKIEDGCDTVCTCMNGKMDCTDRCVGPYFRKGKKIDDPLCSEKSVEDPCCSILVCAADTETEPLEMCIHQNKTYHRGEKFQDSCSQICVCEAGGKFSCKPRCRPINKTSDRCVEVPDPADSCCKMVLCDVSLDDHEHKEHEMLKMKLVSAKYVNESAILFKFDMEDKNNIPDVEISRDKINWMSYKLLPGGYLPEIMDDFKYGRIENSDDFVMIQNIDFGVKDHKKNESMKTCQYDDKIYKVGEEFYKNCSSFCICLETGVKCMKIQCPTYFGLDAVNPHCLEWETVPADFVPKAPNCCPKEVHCKTNGSCHYEGQTYNNWQEIPTNVTGCDKRCYCELGKVECQSACPPVPMTPPSTLPCAVHEAELDHLPDDDCCMTWVCARPSIPTGNDDKTPQKTDKQRLNNTNNNQTVKPPSLPTTSAPIINNLHDHVSTDFKGPLLIYENETPIKNRNKTLYNPVPPLSDNEDLSPSFGPGPVFSDNLDKQKFLTPSYENKNNKNVPKDKNGKPESATHSVPWSFEHDKYNNDFVKDKNVKLEGSTMPWSVEKGPPFVVPLNPDKNPIIKAKKRNKTSNANTVPPSKQKNEFSHQINNVPQQISFEHPQYSNIQNPEEILQIINQHPDLANYPPGSVFEIHNYPHDVKPDNSDFVIPTTASKFGENPIQRPSQSQHPVGPYLINQIDPTGTQNSNFPPNIPINQLIKHVHEGHNSPGLTRPVAPYSQNAQFPQNPIFAQPGLQYSVLNQPQLNQSTGFDGLAGRFPNVPGHGFQQSPDEISVQQVDAIDSQTVRLIFTVSSLIVGLHGRVEVRYTNRLDENIANWELQVFAPPNDLIATQQLEFDLIGLEPNTEYKIKITVILRNLHNTPTSRVYNVRTPAPTVFSTMPPMISVDPNLAITNVNSTWVNVVWRKLTDFELQFVDGVQLRYKEISGKVYAATPLIHRAVTSYTLENLKPDTEYEVGIFFIPFTGQNTELNAENMVHFTTSTEIDPYGFNVSLEIQLVKATTVDVAWSGVPYPEDKYVNIYRAIYQSDSGKGDSSTFKIAKRDSPKKTTITDLKPGTRYRLWLEVYLTNGKIKTSNVQDFITKPRTAAALGAATQQGKLSTSEVIPDHSNDYYGPLVIVAVLAAIAILSTLILLMILLRRHNQNKASISTPSRVSQAAYDNPTYKVEIQQETMGL